jgi:hypothetical protein
MKTRMSLGIILTILSVSGWGQGLDTIQRRNPIEWGKSYKKEFILIQEMKKSGMMNLKVEVLAVENLTSNEKYHYIRFEAPQSDTWGIRTALMVESEIDEVLLFCQKLSDYVNQNKSPNYVEYRYDSFDREFLLGAYWNVKNATWTFFITIDPRGMPKVEYYFDTTYVPQMYQALLNCKATIARLKRGGK